MKRMFLPLAVVTVIMSLLLIGCGGGGGGGNPVATTTTTQLVSVTGKVVLNDQPQSNAIVSLRSSGDAELAGLAEQFAAKASARGQTLSSTVSTDSFVTTTDGSGIYRFDNVPEGEYTLQAENPQTRKIAVITGLVVSAVRGAVTTQNAELQPTSEIAGKITVSGYTGSLAGGRVYLAGTSFLALTDTTGNFRIAYVPTGTTFSLMADLNGAVLENPITIEAIAGSSAGSPALPGDLILVKPVLPVIPTGTITGTVTRSPYAAGDTDHSGTLVSLIQNGKIVTFTETTPAGAYAFADIPTTPNNIYAIRFMAPNYIVPATPLSVTVPANDTVAAPAVTLTPRMAVLGGLTGRVVRNSFIDAEPSMDLIPLKIATGTPGSTGYFEKLTVADENGFFAFTGVPVGTYSVFCGDLDYVFPSPATVQAGNPIINNGVLTLIPNPSAKGTGVLVATITTSLTAPTRVILVSQVSPANSRETYAVPLVAGSLSFRMSGLLSGNYELHLDQETGWDITPAVNIVNITQNTVASKTFSTVSILPAITAVATSPTSIAVTGSNLNSNYRIQVSHLGQEPWTTLPTTYRITAPNLIGTSTSLLGGRYMLQVAVPNSNVLLATYPTEILLPPHPILSATPITRPDSITVNWPSVPGISQYKAIIRTTVSSPFVREATTTAPTAVFSGLEPATSYNIELYTVVDGVFSSVYQLTAILTQGVQMAPLTASFPYVLQGSSFTNNPNMLVASGGVLYFLEGDTSPQYLSSLDTTTGATQSVMLGSVMSTSKIFSGSAGLYVIQQESLDQVIQQYAPNTLDPTAFSYTMPADSDMMQATYCAATDRIYCVRINTSQYLATMTVLMPDLSLDGPETPLPPIPMEGTPINLKVEASRDGSTVGFACVLSGDGTFNPMFMGFFTSTRESAAIIRPANYESILSIQGGLNGNLFVYYDTGSVLLFDEYKPTLNKQFAIISERQFPTGRDFPAQCQVDGSNNRWIMDMDTAALTAYDSAYFPARVFNLQQPHDLMCYDPVTRSILLVTSSGSMIDVNKFDANF